MGRSLGVLIVLSTLVAALVAFPHVEHALPPPLGLPTTPSAVDGESIATSTEIAVEAEPAEMLMREPEITETPVAEVPLPIPAPEPEQTVSNALLAYSTPVRAYEDINTDMRAALVNILCYGTPPLRSTSGSGIMISPDGLVLTNAHIGQNVLLEEVGASVNCVARIGSPALAEWHLETVYFPPAWAKKYASSITQNRPTGTGEDDFAILRVVRDETTPLPHLPFDSREEAVFGGVVLGAYPAEFIRGSEIQRSLNALSAYSSVQGLYTFVGETLDAFSIGSNPLAQQGSSGGAVVNAWGFLIGVITTRTEGANTAERELRAISTAHIDRSMREAIGISLEDFSREPSSPAAAAAVAEAGSFLEAALP